MVQWLRFLASNTLGTSSIPGQGTKIPHSASPKKSLIKTIVYVCGSHYISAGWCYAEPFAKERE